VYFLSCDVCFCVVPVPGLNVDKNTYMYFSSNIIILALRSVQPTAVISAVDSDIHVISEGSAEYDHVTTYTAIKSPLAIWHQISISRRIRASLLGTWIRISGTEAICTVGIEAYCALMISSCCTAG
jgi:hypothetical protein